MSAVADRSLALTGHDLYLFREGTHARLYEKLGAHWTQSGASGATQFSVWAPNAASVSVVGDFNGWDPRANVLSNTGESGICQTRVPQAKPGSLYKFHIVSRHAGYRVDKADPFAFRSELAPRTASVVWDLGY